MQLKQTRCLVYFSYPKTHPKCSQETEHKERESINVTPYPCCVVIRLVSWLPLNHKLRRLMKIVDREWSLGQSYSMIKRPRQVKPNADSSIPTFLSPSPSIPLAGERNKCNQMPAPALRSQRILFICPHYQMSCLAITRSWILPTNCSLSLHCLHCSILLTMFPVFKSRFSALCRSKYLFFTLHPHIWDD